jgi:hypothetical protein
VRWSNSNVFSRGWQRQVVVPTFGQACASDGTENLQEAHSLVTQNEHYTLGFTTSESGSGVTSTFKLSRSGQALHKQVGSHVLIRSLTSIVICLFALRPGLRLRLCKGTRRAKKREAINGQGERSATEVGKEKILKVSNPRFIQADSNGLRAR